MKVELLRCRKRGDKKRAARVIRILLVAHLGHDRLPTSNRRVWGEPGRGRVLLSYCGDVLKAGDAILLLSLLFRPGCGGHERASDHGWYESCEALRPPGRHLHFFFFELR